MFVRVQDFGAAHNADFGATSLGKQLFTSLSTIITELESKGASEVSGMGVARQGTVTRREARGALRDDLEAINRTARAMADDVPGASGLTDCSAEGLKTSHLVRVASPKAVSWGTSTVTVWRQLRRRRDGLNQKMGVGERNLFLTSKEQKIMPGLMRFLSLRALVLTLLMVVGVGEASAACPIPNFTSVRTTVPLSKAMVVADFNKDGNPDVAIALYSDFSATSRVAIHLGTGTGFSSNPINTTAGRSMLFIASGDLNGDTNPDLIVVNGMNVHGEIDGEIEVLLGNGTGQFLPPSKLIFVGHLPNTVAISDVNGDGKLDFVLTTSNTSSVLVGLGDGAGNFTVQPSFPSGGLSPSFLLTPDLNKDSKPDLVVINNGNSTTAGNVAVFINNGTGTFTSATFLAGAVPVSATVGDFNGDTNLDLAVANNGNDTVSILLGNGSGSFAAAANFPMVGKGPQAITHADFNGDSKIDLAVTNSDLGTVVFILGDGAGGFSPVANFRTGGSFGSLVTPETLAVTDFSKDGLPDLVSVSGRTLVSFAISCGTPTPRTVEFNNPFYGGSEEDIVNGTGEFTPVIIRTGDITPATVSVDFATSDQAGSAPCNDTVTGFASARCDYLATFGTAHFSGNQISYQLSVPVTNDSYIEDSELFLISLNNPQGAVLGSQTAATMLINDNENFSDGPNPLNDASFFVRQHYVDFLNREPDASGLAFWTNQITSCGSDQACIEVRRINVSAAFFLSIEFQETGYLVERLYKSAYGDATGTSNFGPTHQIAVPIIRFDEFLPDTQEIGKDVIVGEGDWQASIEANKVAFIQEFVARARFTTAFPTTLTPAQFVDALFLNARVTPSTAERDGAIAEFGGAGNTTDTAARARALRRVAENATLAAQEKNKAFVLTQYFGYLRRDPNSSPDIDYSGYDFWLTKLNQFNGNFIEAEMVKAFIISGEYRARFGP